MTNSSKTFERIYFMSDAFTYKIYNFFDLIYFKIKWSNVVVFFLKFNFNVFIFH